MGFNSLKNLIEVWDHLFITFAKFSEKLTFLTLDTRTYVCIPSDVTNVNNLITLHQTWFSNVPDVFK